MGDIDGGSDLAQLRQCAAELESSINHAIEHAWAGEDKVSPRALQEALAELESIELACEKNTEASPEIEAALFNRLGLALIKLDCFKESVDVLEKGISLDPINAALRYNIGLAYSTLNRHEDAVGQWRALVALGAHADSHYALGMELLKLGHLQEGFQYYEQRMLATKYWGMPPQSQLKKGENIKGKSVFIMGEGGLGDTIQFIRYLPKVMELGASEVTLMVQRPIQPMVNIDGVRLIPIGQNVEFDRWLSFLSFPYYFNLKDEKDIPPPWIPPSIPPNPSWRERPGFRVGVCWSGNPTQSNDRHRSISLNQFSYLFDVPNCRFVSVHLLRDTDRELVAKLPLEAFEFDLARAAGVLKSCDVVVTVDTMIAHLAASLGVRTWILLPAQNTDWRWQLNRTDSPWYPTATLYRQETVGDWMPALKRVKRDLRETAGHAIDELVVLPNEQIV